MTLAATRPASWILARVLPYIDRVVLNLTRSRQTATEVLTGLPVLMLTTEGAITGRRYRTPLVYFREDQKYLLVATKFGQRENPGWYYNILANPEVEVTIDGMTSRYLGNEVIGSDRSNYWEMAVAHYPGYLNFQRRAVNRTIPLLLLSPLEKTVDEEPE